MPHVSMRVTEQEKKWMESYAKLHGIRLSDALKEAFFAKIEDEYDIEIIKEYEIKKAEDKITYFTLAETKRELGF